GQIWTGLLVKSLTQLPRKHLCSPPPPSCSVPGQSLTLFSVAARPRPTRPRDLGRRRARVKQLSFFNPPGSMAKIAIWSALDDEQKAVVVARLARLIIQTATGSRVEPEENADE